MLTEPSGMAVPGVRFVNCMQLTLFFQFTGSVASEALCLAKMNYSAERVASAPHLYYSEQRHSVSPSHFTISAG